MRWLADTHLLIWAAISPEKLSPEAEHLLSDPSQEILFSTASIWETAIKQGRRHPDFHLDPVTLRDGLLRAGYSELLISSEHAVHVARLPPFHRDPCDRLLVPQASVEGLLLLTADTTVARYAGTKLI